MLNGKGRNRKKHHKKSSENKLFHGPNVAREPRFRKRDGHIAIEKSNVCEPNLGEPSLTTERAHFSLGAGRNRTDEPFSSRLVSFFLRGVMMVVMVVVPVCERGARKR
jgi:hypothetical protein